MEHVYLLMAEKSNFPTFDPMLELEQLGITFKDPVKVSPFNKEEVIECLARGAMHLDTSRTEAPETTTRCVSGTLFCGAWARILCDDWCHRVRGFETLIW